MQSKYFLFLIFALLLSCSKDDEASHQQPDLQAGVVISFDDDYVAEWFDVNTILQAYDWKATFFVTRFNQLSASNVQKLKDLKSDGHEIGGHGLNHLNAVEYITQNGTSNYVNQEILPMTTLMSDNQLTPTSFAYPFGARNPTTDNLLLDEFQIIRGTTYGNTDPALQNCYYKNSRIVLGLGIDESYPHSNIPYFLSLLEYAKNNSKVVIFYAHKPVHEAHNDYETEYQTLIEICNYVQNNEMKFYKMSELYMDSGLAK